MTSIKEVFAETNMKYKKMFGSTFPTLECLGRTDEQYIELMNKCIESGTPYDPYDNGRIPKYVKF